MIPKINDMVIRLCKDFYSKGYEDAIKDACLCLQGMLQVDRDDFLVATNYSTKEDFVGDFKEVLQKRIRNTTIKEE